MSRVGKYPVVVKDGVMISFDNAILKVKGIKGESSIVIPEKIKLEYNDSNVILVPLDNSKDTRSIWGTLRSLINNMVIGVSDGFKVVLELNGVGFRAAVQGKNLVMQLGYSHEVIFPIPEEVSIICPDSSTINVIGIDKQVVGQVAAKIRSFRKPEPYKGKGIKYSTETIRRKEGKKK